jgi:hypothetical protein
MLRSIENQPHTLPRQARKPDGALMLFYRLFLPEGSATGSASASPSVSWVSGPRRRPPCAMP